ncbi:MAG: winged helix-turn-helix transcriptional regulator [Saprospiraceae bacterium]|nr:winged helix-turn-helix transcriptional regulator [Saprospiraceae bacterium]
MNALFKALNDEVRRDILTLLKSSDLSAGEIADHFAIGRPTISHHLDLLRQAELVTSEKKGQYIYYSINTSVLDEVLKWIYTLGEEKDHKYIRPKGLHIKTTKK